MLNIVPKKISILHELNNLLKGARPDYKRISRTHGVTKDYVKILYREESIKYVPDRNHNTLINPNIKYRRDYVEAVKKHFLELQKNKGEIKTDK